MFTAFGKMLWARLLVMAGAEERTMLGLGGYGDLLASIALDHRPEVIIGKALAKGKSVDDAVLDAKLRVEAITLIPRVVAFAKEHRIKAPTFDILAEILQGARPEKLIPRLFV